MNIESIDKNFVIETNIERDGLVFYNIEEEPFAIYGVKKIGSRYRRMPREVAEATSKGVLKLHAQTAGGRVRFVTDSPYIAISAKMSYMSRMSHFAFSGSAGMDLYTGKRYVGTFQPKLDAEGGFESVVDICDACEREYTIHLPLYSRVEELYIGIKDGSVLKAAPKYAVEKPVVYYGSSITQGACASRPGNAYENIISRELDCDHINLGFSGNAKGEQVMADYIAGLEMSVFVCDYDHNAPNVEHLRDTHERMFKTIRAAQPELPIIMLTRPRYYLIKPGDAERLEVVRQTYENAIAAGDENVYFIPGPELIVDLVREASLVDGTHPNDSGFVSMAYVIGNKLKDLL